MPYRHIRIALRLCHVAALFLGPSNTCTVNDSMPSPSDKDMMPLTPMHCKKVQIRCLESFSPQGHPTLGRPSGLYPAPSIVLLDWCFVDHTRPLQYPCLEDSPVLLGIGVADCDGMSNGPS